MTTAENPLVTIEEFLKVKPGHRVQFQPRDAIGGPRGLRKTIRGVVSRFDAQGRAYIGDWIVPAAKVQRSGSGAYREWAKAERKAQRKEVYGGLNRGEKKKLETCAKDARQAFLATSKYSGPQDKSFPADTKRQREKFMRERGIYDSTDKGQCDALPLFLERALSKGEVPKLRGVEYHSSETGNVGVGDTITLAGDKFKIVGYTPEGNLRLKDGREITVPPEYVPVDAAAPVKSVFTKLAKRRLERASEEDKKPAKPVEAASPAPEKPAALATTGATLLARTRHRALPRRDITGGQTLRRRHSQRRRHRLRRTRECFDVCVRRDRHGRFIRQRSRNPVHVEQDLLGRKTARLSGPSGKGHQIPLLDREHAFTPDEKRDRRAWKKERKAREAARSGAEVSAIYLRIHEKGKPNGRQSRLRTLVCCRVPCCSDWPGCRGLWARDRHEQACTEAPSSSRTSQLTHCFPADGSFHCRFDLRNQTPECGYADMAFAMELQ